jgi:hypothetical protein
VLEFVAESDAQGGMTRIMTDLELKELVAGLAVRQTETDQRVGENDRFFKETKQLLAEHARERVQTERLMQETDRQIKELGRQLGGLGQKFGGFTEGMAFPSMTKILRERFGMSVVSPRVSSRKNGQTMEIDVLAYSNADINEVYAVEVKSHLRDDGLEQMLRIVREFHYFFPGHEGKKVYGILAAVDIPEDIRQRVLREGIYLACIHDDNFELQIPEEFHPRAF